MEMCNSDRGSVNPDMINGNGDGGAELKLFGVRLMPTVNTNRISNQQLMINERLIANGVVSNNCGDESLIQSNNYSNSMRKSFSMGNLALHSSASGKWQYSHRHQMNHSPYNNNNSNSSFVQGCAGFMNTNENGVDGGSGAAGIASANSVAAVAESGYVSDGMVHASARLRERKKGVPWSEDEHRLFLLGLQKLGKGDWRGISKNYVTSRTPTQVASHAQKYFLRQSNLNKRKRRSSLFDIITSCNSSSQVPQMNGSNNDQVLHNSDHHSSSSVTPMAMDVISLANNPKFCTTTTIPSQFKTETKSEAEDDLSLSLQIQDPHIKTKAPSIFNLPMNDDVNMQDTRQAPEAASFTSEPIPSSASTATLMSMPTLMSMSMSMSLPTTRLSAVPLCRIDETVELSNLSLSIDLNTNPANPTIPTTKETTSSVDINQLSLNLELQPAASADMHPKHTTLCHSSPTTASASATVNAMVAAAAAASSSQTNTTSYPNAISVV